jgi:hypothetical protein
MFSGSPKKLVLGQLIITISLSVSSGMFFILGFASWLRGSPVFWAQIAVAVASLVVVILLCRRILQIIP